MSKRLYILIRDDLKKGSQAVQGGHALAQWLIEHPINEWNNSTLIYLRVPYQQLELWQDIAKIKHMPCSTFVEPDLNYELTAIAILADEESKKMFSNLPLLR